MARMKSRLVAEIQVPEVEEPGPSKVGIRRSLGKYNIGRKPFSKPVYIDFADVQVVLGKGTVCCDCGQPVQLDVKAAQNK